MGGLSYKLVGTAVGAVGGATVVLLLLALLLVRANSVLRAESNESRAHETIGEQMQQFQQALDAKDEEYRAQMDSLQRQIDDANARVERAVKVAEAARDHAVACECMLRELGATPPARPANFAEGTL